MERAGSKNAPVQLWTVENRETNKRIYIRCHRWFDVREVGSQLLQTGGDFSKLFISAVMDPEFDPFGMDCAIYEVKFEGSAASNPSTLRRVVKKLRDERSKEVRTKTR